VRLDKYLHIENISTTLPTVPFWDRSCGKVLDQEYSFAFERDKEYYTDEIRDLVYTAYKEDFDNYGYPKERL
jgi:hypothetical protein